MMRWLSSLWYRDDAPARVLGLLLWPLALLFGAVAALRRAAFRAGLLRATRLPVPVVIVGNLSAGGTGKTPLAIALARGLAARGRHPGIVSRGYGGRAVAPRAVHAGDDPRETGDEPLLLARHAGCPVWIGAARVAAARALLAAHPECDLLIADDGLQHYALARDFEIAVIDAARGLGNGRLLPAGPLREPPARLATVDAIVLNGAGTPALPAGAPVHRMTLAGDRFVNLRDPQRSVDASHFAGRRAHAVAGIGNPQRFFTQLRMLGIDCVEHPFADHHAFVPADLEFGGGPVLMTEKDAVKCRDFAGADCWALHVEAEIAGELLEQLTRHLGKT